VTDEELDRMEQAAQDNLRAGPPSDFTPEDVLRLLHEVRCARRYLARFEDGHTVLLPRGVGQWLTEAAERHHVTEEEIFQQVVKSAFKRWR
jgi:hypothetical protein